MYNSSFHTKLAQSFTPSVSGQLDKISVYLGNSSGSTSPVTAEIRTYSGGPTETILASTSVVVPYSFSGAWTDFVFSSPPSLTAGTGYAIVLTGPNSINWYGSTDYNSYVNGAAWRLYTNGTSGDTTDDYWTTSFPSTFGDFAFRTYRLLHAPTNITLSKSSVPEREPAGTTVGTFSTTDVDSGDTFTYTLVSGDGSAGNAAFTISGNTLLTAAKFDYETKNSYSIRVRSTDAAGLYYEKIFIISVTYVEPVLELDQEQSSTTQYANLSNFAYDQYGQTFTAGLTGNLGKVSLYIQNDNQVSVTMQIQGTASGVPNGTVLATTTVDIPAYGAGRWVDFIFSSPANVTSGTQYALTFNPFNSISINNTYSGGQAIAHFSSNWVAASNVAQDFAFRTYVIDVPPALAPTDISLSKSTVAENQHAGAFVGTFSTTDPNGADTFAYSLVTGEGDTDNALFSISGSNLVTATMLDYEAKPSLSIRVRSTDQTDLYCEKVFTITVTDVAPSLQLDQQQPTSTSFANLLAWNYDQFGQTFTAGLSGNLGKVSFNFYTLEPISVTVEIQAVTGGLPNGTSLASTTVDVPGSGANQWVDFTFSSPAYVKYGTQYAALLSPKFNSVDFSSNTYSGGQVVAHAGSSWTGAISTSIPDFAFKTYVIEAPVYTVTFDSQGGSGVTSQSVAYGGKATEPTAPTREGYTFSGWYTDTTYATAWNFASDTVTGNMTLYAKWTIGDHAPTITAQPQNTAVVVGEQASFTVKYTGLPEPAFQWQLSTNNGRKWSNIAGANSDTYTTPAAASKMNGYQYRVILSNNLGSVTSETATLAVTAGPVAVADVSITKTGTYNPVTNTVTWTITVTNSGPDAAEGVVVTDNLSNNNRVLSVTTGYSYKINGKKVIFEIGTLGNESSVEISVIEALVIRATGEVTNTAEVTTISYDPDLTNNTDTKSITVL